MLFLLRRAKKKNKKRCPFLYYNRSDSFECFFFFFWRFPSISLRFCCPCIGFAIPISVFLFPSCFSVTLGSKTRRGRCLQATVQMLDSHCHLLPPMATLSGSETASASAFPCSPTESPVVVFATHPLRDWSALAQLAAQQQQQLPGAWDTAVAVGFGIHPWYVENFLPEANDSSRPQPTLGQGNAELLSSADEVSESSETCCCRAVLQALPPPQPNFSGAVCAIPSSETADDESSSSHNSGAPLMTLDAALTGLRRLLERFPLAAVGEIGLDRIAVQEAADNLWNGAVVAATSLQAKEGEEKGKTSQYSTDDAERLRRWQWWCGGASSKAEVEKRLEDHQRDAFMAQMRMAREYQRPVSVHCVRSFGLLLDCLTKLSFEQFPPAVVLHGYTGSVDFAKSLLKLPPKKSSRIFFGVGSRTTATTKAFRQLVARSSVANGVAAAAVGSFQIPVGKLLLETDGFLRWHQCQLQGAEKAAASGCILLCDEDVLARRQELKDAVTAAAGDNSHDAWATLVQESNDACRRIFFPPR
jgi:Tat protein secretion system quality control protein TatD with DNase activity